MILDAVPEQLVAGDTWRWSRSFADYPASTWTVTYYFENAGKQFSAAGIASGTDHSFSVDATTSGAVPAGRYAWKARAVSGSISETIDGERGWLEVLADPAAVGTRDHRSWARRTLDALEATLEGKASADQLAMSIAGRSISRIPLNELVQWRDRLRGEVRGDEGGSAGGKGRTIKVRLSRG